MAWDTLSTIYWLGVAGSLCICIPIIVGVLVSRDKDASSYWAVAVLAILPFIPAVNLLVLVVALVRLTTSD